MLMISCLDLASLRLPENHFDSMMSESFWGARIIGYPALPAARMQAASSKKRSKPTRLQYRAVHPSSIARACVWYTWGSCMHFPLNTSEISTCCVAQDDAPGLSCGEHTDYGCWIILAQDRSCNWFLKSCQNTLKLTLSLNRCADVGLEVGPSSANDVAKLRDSISPRCLCARV